MNREKAIEILENLLDCSYIDSLEDEEKDALKIAIKSLKTGIMLPKHHGDLIDVNKKITVPVYDEQFEEWSEQTLTVLDAINKWSNEGITTKDVIIQSEESEG